MYMISTLQTKKYYYDKLRKIYTNADICQVYGFRRLNILKMCILSKSIYAVSTVPVQIPALVLECKGQGTTEAIPEKNGAGGGMLPDFKTYGAGVIRTVWQSHRARDTDQRDRVEPRNSPVHIRSLDL